MAVTIYDVLDRIEAAKPEVLPRGVTVPPDATPLEFLRSVYTDPSVALPLRIRAAVEAAPFHHPKLSATYDLGQAMGRRMEKLIAEMEGRAEGRLPEPD
jgi:hypothetical protein